ncbi:MAG TPA: hypothetical protein VEC09_00785 [Actinomycetota bacterium]|nr:hypothetical protein [Actinomycetota bacterium]
MSPRRSPRRGEPTDARAERPDHLGAAALAVVLTVWFLLPFALDGSGYPLGPDGPVYLWWTRLAGVDGLSAVPRPGVPAVALTLVGALHLPLAAVMAALEVVLAVALGVAAQALARAAGGDRGTAFVAGLLAGTFAVHLASGYLATLAFAVGFVAGLVAVGTATRWGTVLGAGCFAAAVLSHPLFALLGLAIIVVLAAMSWRSHRDDVRRLGAAVVGAGAVTAAGLVTLTMGPGPLDVETSRDGFLRRAGLGDMLRSAYLDRVVHRWTRYVQWISLALTVLALRDRVSERGGLVRRALVAWLTVTVLGVVVTLATGWLPPDRFLTFGFAIPILAAFGLAALARRLRERPRPVALGAPALLLILMLAGSWIAWARQDPFIEDREVAQVTAANDVVRRTSAGTALVFLVNERDDTVTFLAARAANVIRAVIDADRIRDVMIVVPRSSPSSSVERAAVEELTNADLRRAIRAGPIARIGLTAFDTVDFAGDTRPWGRVAPGVFAIAEVAAADPPVNTGAPPTEGSSPGAIAAASVLTLVLLTVGGYGWARVSGVPSSTAIAVAPAVGWGVLVLVAVAAERLGVPLTGAIGPIVVSAIAALGGFGARALLERRVVGPPTP